MDLWDRRATRPGEGDTKSLSQNAVRVRSHRPRAIALGSVNVIWSGPMGNKLPNRGQWRRVDSNRRLLHGEPLPTHSQTSETAIRHHFRFRFGLLRRLETETSAQQRCQKER